MPHLLPQTVNFVIIRNPLVPDMKQLEARDFVPHQPLSAYIGELSGLYAFSINGRVIRQEDLALEIPKAGDVIAISPIPLGGGGGGAKTIVRLVAVVALTYFTAGIAGGSAAGLLGSGTLTAGSFGATALAAAATIGGTMLINAMLPYSSGNAANSGSGTSNSTYGVDGAKNTSEEGLPFPVVYGHYRQAGNIIGNYTTLSGQTQYLHMLLNAGEGVSAGIVPGSIQLNDQPIESLTDATYQFFHGNDAQATPGVFDRQITPNQVVNNREMKKASIWTTYDTSVEKEVEGVRLDFLTNIYKINDQGNEEPHSVDVIAEIKPYGTADTEFRPLLTGIKVAYSAQGWIIDMTGQRLITGAVTESKTGSQLIDPTRPNILDKTTGRYLNYYVLNAGKYELQGEAVTPKGAKSTTYTMVNGTRVSKPENTVAPKVLASAAGLVTYDYGNLMSSGVQVGTYHKFHTVNKIVQGYNADAYSVGAQGDATLHFSGSDASATMRFSFETPRLPEGRYSIRARRVVDDSTDEKIGDTIVLNEVSEIIYSDIAYNHTALLYIRVKISDQLNSIPKVTFVNRGRVIRVWDEQKGGWVASADIGVCKYPVTSKERLDFPVLSAAQNKQAAKKLGTMTPNVLALAMPPHTLPMATASLYDAGFFDHDNPAWIAWDILTDARFGGGIDPSRLDFWAFKKWADFCRSKNLTFRAVVDSKGSLWDTLAQVFRIGRATPVRTGTRYTVSVEMPKEPVMSFGMDNIVEGSFAINWMGINDRANEVELTYYDEAYDYKQRVIKVYDKQAFERGAKPITSSAKLIGIVTNEHAIREANYMLNVNKLVETVSFTAPVEALACTIGSVVEVQHDMMTWGEAGKIEKVLPVSGSTFDLVLDHAINFTAGKVWKANLQCSVVQRGIFTVEAVTGGYVTLTGFNPSIGRVTRAKVVNVETPAFDTFTGTNGKSGIIVRDYDAFTVGSNVTLYDTDVIVTATATPTAYGTPVNQIRVTGLPHVPQQYDHFMLGFPEFTARLFTIRSIGLTSDSLTRQITALEYDARVFDDSDTDFIVTDDAYESALSAVEGVEVTETPVYQDGALSIRANISWLHSTPRYKNAEVTATINNGPIQNLGRKRTFANIDVKKGDHVEFTITPYSISGKKGAMLRTGFDATGVQEGANTMPIAGGSVTGINGGVAISGLTWNQYLVKQVEVWAIRQGTMINGGYTGGSAGTNTKIESLPNPALINEAGVVLYGVLVGYADRTGRFVHVVSNPADEGAQFFYWARSVDLVDAKGPYAYVGSGRPIVAAMFDDVTYYTYSVAVPARPTGGSYATPKPDQAIWLKTPDPAGPPSANAALFVTSRRFCSVAELSDPTWTLPSAIYDPKSPDIIESALKPVNVMVTSGFGSIRVTWDRPAYEGHDKTQVYVQRVTVDAGGAPQSPPVLNTATMLAAEESSTMASIPAAAGYGYYVWVRHVNKAGVQSAFFAANGFFILVRLTPDEMDKLLNSQIKFDFLADDVENALNKAGTDSANAIARADAAIATANGVAGDASSALELATEANDNVNAALVGADEALAAANAAIEAANGAVGSADSAIAGGLKALLNINQAERTRRQDIFGGTGARALTKDLELRVLGEGGEIERLERSIETVAGGAGSGFNEIIESMATLDASMAMKIDEIYAKFDDVDLATAAQISEVEIAIADANEAIADLTTTVSANKTLQDNALAAEVSARQQAITNEAGARATDISSVRADLTTANAAISAEVTARTQAITTVNSSISSLDTTLRGLINTEKGRITTEITDRTNAITTVNSSIASMDTTLRGLITTEQGRITTEISDRKTAVTTVEGSVASLDTRLTGSISTANTKIDTEITNRTTADTTINSSITALDTRLTGNINTEKSRITTEITDRTNAITTVNGSIASLDTTLRGLITTESGRITTEISDRKTAITTEADARASADSTLTTSINTEKGRITTEISDRANAITTVNGSIASLDTRLTGSIATTDSKVTTEISDRKAADTTINGSISTLDTTLRGLITTEKNRITTEITDRTNAITTVNSSIATQDTTLRGLITTEQTRITTEISDRKAAITTEQGSRAALETSLTSSINGVDARVTTLSSTVVTNDGKYVAQWGVKTTVDTLTGGVGFYNDGVKTSFLIDADVFALISKNGGSSLVTSPFKVVAGKAYIADAYIDNAVINNIVANKVTASYVNALNVTAKYVSASMSITSPVISGGTLDLTNIYMNSSGAGFGKGGAYSGMGYTWYTLITSSGYLYTNRLYANGGTIDNMTIGSCTISADCNVQGTIYANKIVGDVVRIVPIADTLDQTITFPSWSQARIVSVSGCHVYAKGGYQVVSGETVDRWATSSVSITVNGSTTTTSVTSDYDRQERMRPAGVTIEIPAYQTISVRILFSGSIQGGSASWWKEVGGATVTVVSKNW